MSECVRQRTMRTIEELEIEWDGYERQQTPPSPTLTTRLRLRPLSLSFSLHSLLVSYSVLPYIQALSLTLNIVFVSSYSSVCLSLFLCLSSFFHALYLSNYSLYWCLYVH